MSVDKRVFPRLPRATAVEMYQSLEGKSSNELRALSRGSHSHAQIPSGSVITAAELENFRDRLRFDLIDSRLSRGSFGRGDSNFDQELGRWLLASLPITPYEAAEPRVWHFLSLVLLPEVGPWRFPLVTKDRFVGPPIRNVLGRTWWRAHLLGPDLRCAVTGAEPLNEDELYSLIEKTTIGFDEVLVTRAAEAIYRFQKSSKNRNGVVREFTKLLLRTIPTIDVVSFEEDQMRNFLDRHMRRASEIVNNRDSLS